MLTIVVLQARNGNRNGNRLSEAVEWCKHRGIEFDAVNENLPEIIAAFNNDCRKIFADEYIDDRAIPMPGEATDLLSEMSREVYFIRERVGEAEILAQFAEECAELAQAALKYRRALTGNNPTPMSVKTAGDNLLEEMADVSLCMSMLGRPEAEEQKQMIERSKLLRWAKRLREND